MRLQPTPSGCRWGGRGALCCEGISAVPFYLRGRLDESVWSERILFFLIPTRPFFAQTLPHRLQPLSESPSAKPPAPLPLRISPHHQARPESPQSQIKSKNQIFVRKTNKTSKKPKKAQKKQKKQKTPKFDTLREPSWQISRRARNFVFFVFFCFFSFLHVLLIFLSKFWFFADVFDFP